MTTFFVAGKPAPQGSYKHVGNGRIVPASKYLKPWRRVVFDVATLHRTRDAALFATQPLSVTLLFIMPRPKYAIGKELPAVKRPDLDKTTRAILDGITGACFGDDAQVTHIDARKVLALPGEEVGVHITYARDTFHLDRLPYATGLDAPT